jgi:hypothetical protein
MSEGDEIIPSIVARKWKKRFGLRFSSKNALKCSRLERLIAKARGRDVTSITKALVFPSRSPIERYTTNLLKPFDKLEDRIEINLGDAISVVEYP